MPILPFSLCLKAQKHTTHKNSLHPSLGTPPPLPSSPSLVLVSICSVMYPYGPGDKDDHSDSPLQTEYPTVLFPGDSALI